MSACHGVWKEASTAAISSGVGSATVFTLGVAASSLGVDSGLLQPMHKAPTNANRANMLRIFFIFLSFILLFPA